MTRMKKHSRLTLRARLASFIARIVRRAKREGSNEQVSAGLTRKKRNRVKRRAGEGGGVLKLEELSGHPSGVWKVNHDGLTPLFHVLGIAVI